MDLINFKLLSQLTTVGNISFDDFENRFNEINKNKYHFIK